MLWTGRPLISSGPDGDGIDGQEAVDAFFDGCFGFGIPGDGFFDESFDEVGVLDVFGGVELDVLQRALRVAFGGKDGFDSGGYDRREAFKRVKGAEVGEGVAQFRDHPPHAGDGEGGVAHL